jgi:hypothetical protein
MSDEPHIPVLHDISHLQRIVDDVRQEPSKAKQACVRFKYILEEYQEQPQLLDAHLDSLISPLTGIVSDSSENIGDEEKFTNAMQVCRLLQALVSTRGHKTLSRFFPNKPPDFEKALLILLKSRSKPSRREVDEDQQDGGWQTTFVALMWLSSLAMIPFDLNTLQSVAIEQFTQERAVSVVDWLVHTGRNYLSDPGPCRSELLDASMCTRVCAYAPYVERSYLIVMHPNLSEA